MTLALSACSAEPGGDDPPPDPPTEDPATPEPTEVATPEASTEEATPVEPATEAVTEEDESVPQFEGVLAAEPYVIEPKPIQPGLTDGFTFWGWSTDGARFAFETYMPGEGAVECDMRYDVFVVDSATDEFVWMSRSRTCSIQSDRSSAAM